MGSKGRDDINRFAVGVGFGVAAAVLIGSLSFSIATERAVFEALWKWQTLIAGMLALVGAGVTVRSMNAQSRQLQDQYRDRIERQQYAARAGAPAALAELMNYTQAMLAELRALPRADEYDISDLREEMGKLDRMPALPTDAMKVLRVCIETANKKSGLQIFES